MPSVAALIAGALGLACAGCDMIFGINAGTPRADAGAAQADAGTDGGDESAPGDEGASGDCTKDPGEGSFTVTDVVDANIETITFEAQEGVTVSRDPQGEMTTVTISGGKVPLHCDIEMMIDFAGTLRAGKIYRPVSATTRFDPLFLEGDNVFVVLFADLDCPPPASKRWEPREGAAGSVTVDSIAAGKVQISLLGVHLFGVQDRYDDGQGMVRVDGTAQAPCFNSAP